MTTEELLEQRHNVKLQWVEPWQACGPQGNPLNAHIELSATVHDCINMQRAADKFIHARPGDDARRLEEFMMVHKAIVVDHIQADSGFNGQLIELIKGLIQVAEFSMPAPSHPGPCGTLEAVCDGICQDISNLSYLIDRAKAVIKS